MAFGKKTKSATIRAYTYGARPPVAGWDAARASAEQRRLLWNALAKLEECRRLEQSVLLSAQIPVEERTPAEQAALRVRFCLWALDRLPLKECVKEERDQLRAWRRAAFQEEGMKETLQRLDRATYEAAKPICRSVGCYSWQEDDVLASWRAACRKLDPPRHHHFNAGEGTCALRWQTGLPVAEARAGTDLRLQLLPWCDPDDRRRIPPDPTSKRSQRREWLLCRFRVGSAARKPIWLEIPVCLHRPLPPRGVIRKASLRWWRVADRMAWQLSLVVEEPEEAVSPETLALAPPQPERHVALDVAWRRVPEGVRVAYLLDGEGRGEQMLLPNGWKERVECAARTAARLADLQRRAALAREAKRTGIPIGELAARQPPPPPILCSEGAGGRGVCVECRRAKRDRLFNDACSALVRFRDESAAPLPGWFAAEIQFAGHWRAPGRLVALLRRWEEARFEGDAEIFAFFTDWQVHDRWHWRREAQERQQLVLHRRHVYRNLAARLAREYTKVTLEAFGLRPVARVKETDDGEEGQGAELSEAARAQRVLAAPSELRAAIQSACRREGVTVEKVPAKNTTLICTFCGRKAAPEEAQAARHVVLTCPGCGERDDQDRRACEILLAGGEEPFLKALKERLAKA